MMIYLYSRTSLIRLKKSHKYHVHFATYIYAVFFFFFTKSYLFPCNEGLLVNQWTRIQVGVHIVFKGIFKYKVAILQIHLFPLWRDYKLMFALTYNRIYFTCTTLSWHQNRPSIPYSTQLNALMMQWGNENMMCTPICISERRDMAFILKIVILKYNFNWNLGPLLLTCFTLTPA